MKCFVAVIFGLAMTVQVSLPTNAQGVAPTQTEVVETFKLRVEQGDIFPSLLSGLEPERVDAKTIRLFRGFMSDPRGRTVYASADAYALSFTKAGVGGVDLGPPAVGADYFIYALTTQGTRQLEFILSAAIINSGVKVPESYRVVRKLPWGLKYFGDGVRPFHVHYWPNPQTLYTGASQAPAWAVLNAGRATKPTEIDLTAFVPDNARMVHVLCVTESPGGGAGQAFVQSLPSMKPGVLVGAGQDAFTQVFKLDIRTNSQRKLFFYTTGSAKLSIYVLGYTQSEKS